MLAMDSPAATAGTPTAASKAALLCECPRTATHETTVCGVLTRFVLTAYSNRIFVVVSQTQNMGTLIHASADNPIDAATGSFTTRVLIGKRDDDHLEVYARAMCELICRRAPDAGPLLLAISIQGAHSNEMFRGILKEVEEHRVW